MKGEVNSSRSEISRRREIIHVYMFKRRLSDLIWGLSVDIVITKNSQKTVTKVTICIIITKTIFKNLTSLITTISHISLHSSLTMTFKKNVNIHWMWVSVYRKKQNPLTFREFISNGPQITSRGDGRNARNMEWLGVPSIMETTTRTLGDSFSGNQRRRYCCLSSSS